MKMLRRFNRNGLWKQLFISDKMLNEVRRDLRKDNKNLMELCIIDAKEIMGKETAETNGHTMECMTAIAISLFDKLADPAYTRFQAKLDDLELEARGDTGLIKPDELEEENKEKEEMRQEKINHDNENDDVPTQELMDVEDGL